MWNQRFLLIMLMLLLAVPLAACEDPEEGSGVESNVDTSAYDTQGYVETGGLRVGFMEGWNAKVEGDIIYMATDEDSLGAEQPPSDGAIVKISYIPETAEDTSVTEVLDQYVADNELSYDPAQPDPIMSSRALTSMSTDEFDGEIIVRHYEGAYVIFDIKTAPSQKANLQSKLGLIEVNTSFQTAVEE